MKYLTVAELAKECGVTPQGVNKYMREQGLQSQAVKKGNKFLINENLAETIRNHFNRNEQDSFRNQKQADNKPETTETNTETTETELETVSETNGNDKTPVQELLSQIQAENLETRLQEQKELMQQTIESQQSQIDFLQRQVDNLSGQNAKLLAEHDAIKNFCLQLLRLNTMKQGKNHLLTLKRISKSKAI